MPEPSPWARPEDEDDDTKPATSGGSDGGPAAEVREPGLRADAPAAVLEREADEAESRPEPADPPPPPTAVGTGMAESGGRAPGGSGASGALIPILGMMLMALSALVVGLVVFITRDTGKAFPANRNESDYDLAAMALRVTDLPSGMALSGRVTFDNQEWADLLGGDDPEQRLAQLNAQGRVRNHVSIFRWADDTTGTRHYGTTQSLIAQSTIFDTAPNARESLSGRSGSALKPFCGLAINEKNETKDFPVPKIGDQSVGFKVISPEEPLVISSEIAIPIGTGIETIVCFRTGNIVHGVIQNAREGADDIALVIGLAQRMEQQARHEYEGTPAPLDPEPRRGG